MFTPGKSNLQHGSKCLRPNYRRGRDERHHRKRMDALDIQLLPRSPYQHSRRGGRRAIEHTSEHATP
jgi:hypothetical protein